MEADNDLDAPAPRGLHRIDVVHLTATGGLDLKACSPRPIRWIGLFDRGSVRRRDRVRRSGAETGMKSPEFADAARLLKTLSHPMRLKIVCGLLGEPANLSRMARELGIPTSTLAQHLAVLRHADILEEHRRGVEVVFRVVDRRVPAILRTLCSPELAGGRLPAWSWEELGRQGFPAQLR